MTAANHDMPQSIPRSLNWAFAGLTVFLGTFLIWAIFAPLATTLRLTGSLVSEAPSFDVQHPYGGQIANLYVRQHMSVQRGDVLLQLDTSLDRQNLETFQAMRDRILRENETINHLLAHGEDGAIEHSAHLVLRVRQARAQSDMKQEQAESLADQAKALSETIAHQTRQLKHMEARAERFSALIENSLMTRTAGELLQEQIQLVQSEISSQRAQLISLTDLEQQVSEQAELTTLSMQQELSAILEHNLKRLEELAPQIANLEDVIERATLRAPSDGIVTALHYEAHGMYAGRGQTLLSLAKPLETPIITFKAPTHQIDQLRVGMTGRISFPGLSQRNMPNVTITVRAISPRAETDENGRPVFFEGRAEIDPGGVEALNRAVGEGFTLSADMPVELLVEGRQTTFSKYLTEPLVAAFRESLQD